MGDSRVLLSREHHLPNPLTIGDLMDKIQELRGEIRQLLSDTLISSAEQNKTNATIYREILELLSKVDN